MSLLCSSIRRPENQRFNISLWHKSIKLKFSISKRMPPTVLHKTQHECKQLDSTYSCNDQICTQRFKL
ncbi:hypothetical protein H5410_015604 [Solanum commersonii]|uniref:Uncharacterized protein n=1 Tax=Solanum commersonii TaxID=4109 RepID=A0A9J5ZUX4_SOLCO|nr:hypothetical protein H5410_015604 [Solanum commersonii]